MLVMHFTIKVIPLVFKYLVDNLQLYYQLYTSYRIIIIIILIISFSYVFRKSLIFLMS
jgi:hypothetical protein